MHYTLPTGFRVRRPTMDDLTPVSAMLQVSEMADRGRVTTSESDLRIRWGTPGYDLSKDAWLVIAPDGQMAAMIGVGHRDAERMYASPRVHPDYANLGLQDVLIEFGVEGARELVYEAQDEARVTLNIFCAEKNAEFRRALGRQGALLFPFCTRLVDTCIVEGGKKFC